MKRFRDYLREEHGMDVTSVFPDHEKPLGSFDNSQHDTEAVVKVLRMAVEDHYQEVMDFLHDLALKDPRIGDEIGGLNKEKLNKPFQKKDKPRQGHDVGSLDNEVVPAQADRADGNGTSGAGGGGMGG